MQVEKIGIKKLVMLIFSYGLFPEFLLFMYCFFFFFFTWASSTGLALKFYDNLDLDLYTTTRVSNWHFFLR